MRTHLLVALMIAIFAVTTIAATRIEVTQGVKKFAAGDSITITEVSSEKGTLAACDTITVKGTYTIASQKNARLLLSVTQDTTKAPPSEQQSKGSAHKTIEAGTGKYEMTINISQEGWLHLGFYNPETGKPFGQLYFGTKEQMDKIANWNLDYVTSEQPGKNVIPFRYAVQAEEEVAYEVNLDSKLVSSGKSLVKQYCYLSLCASPGDHILTVTAPGYETWQKTITLLEGSKNGQNFLVELKKSTQGSPVVANSVLKSGNNTISFLCRVQAEAEISYEIHVDGKIVGSGSMTPNPKDKMTHILSATPGDHILTITAPGYETWQKTVTLSEGSMNGSNILAELKKPAK